MNKKNNINLVGLTLASSIISVDTLNTVNNIHALASSTDEGIYTESTENEVVDVFTKVVCKGDTLSFTEDISIICPNGEDINFEYKILDPYNVEQENINTTIVGDWTIVCNTDETEVKFIISVIDNESTEIGEGTNTEPNVTEDDDKPAPKEGEDGADNGTGPDATPGQDGDDDTTGPDATPGQDGDDDTTEPDTTPEQGDGDGDTSEPDTTPEAFEPVLDGTEQDNIMVTPEVVPEEKPDKEEDKKPPLKLNVDTNGDGVADINLDIDGDGKADLNIDTDGDGKADINIDTNGDKIADTNIDKNNDGIADTNISNNKTEKPQTGDSFIDSAILFIASATGLSLINKDKKKIKNKK